jgi:hypothetical protein
MVHPDWSVPMTDTEPAAAPRRSHKTLTPAQLALAEDLAARAERLRADSDGDLSITDAVALAAVQLGYFDLRGSAE